MQQNERTDLEAVLQLNQLQLVMIFRLVNQTEDEAAWIFRSSEHASLVGQPEELYCALDVASKLVLDFFVSVDLHVLSNAWAYFDESGGKTILGQLLALLILLLTKA